LKSQFNLTLTPYAYSKDRVFNDLLSQYNTQELKSSALQFSINQPIKWTDGTLRIIESLDWREASSSFTGSLTETTYRNSLYLSFDQPLFTYNRTKLQLKELELSLENAQLNYAIQRLQIEQQVTRQFLNLYYYNRSVQISREELANARESYEIIKSKVEAGISAEEELYQADLTWANSRASMENSQIQYENALDNFKILLGLSLDEDIEVDADIRKELVEVNVARAIEHGLASRMELRQRDIDIQNALHSLIRTGADNEFEASVNVTYGLVGVDPEFSNMYDSPTRNQSIQVNVNVPLFDWGRKKHRLAAGQAQVDNTRISAEEERKQVTFEIRQAHRNLQNQKTQIDIAEKNVKNARLTYEINLERYRNGDLSSKDISFYQTQLSQEQLNEVSALISYRLALLDLKIRSLWDFKTNQPVVANE
jgi:outer membrane protein TolC